MSFVAMGQAQYATSPKKWTVTAFGSPTLNHVRVIAHDPDWQFMETNPGSKTLFNVSGGAEVSYFWSKNWAISLGGQFVTRGERFALEMLDFPDGIDPFYGFVRPEDQRLNKVTLKHKYHFIDLPIMIQYTHGRKRWRFVSSVGVAPSFLHSVVSELRYVDNSEPKSTQPMTDVPFKTFHLFPIATIGVEYWIQKKWALRVTPWGQYGLWTVTDTPVARKHWSVGTRFSVVYVFSS